MKISRAKSNSQSLACCWRISLVCSLLTPIVAKARGAGRAAAEPQSIHAVRVADCIRMTKLGDPEYWMGGSSAGRVAQFSPDGRKFVVLLRKGNLEQNINEYSLLLWQTEEILHSPAPLTLVTMSSSSNREAIRDITWLGDNETVVLLGEQPAELRQLYSLNIRTHALNHLTNHPPKPITYSIN